MSISLSLCISHLCSHTCVLSLAFPHVFLTLVLSRFSPSHTCSPTCHTCSLPHAHKALLEDLGVAYYALEVNEHPEGRAFAKASLTHWPLHPPPSLTHPLPLPTPLSLTTPLPPQQRVSSVRRRKLTQEVEMHKASCGHGGPTKWMAAGQITP